MLFGGGVMRVAIVTDNDLDRANGLTTTLRAVLRHVPSDIRARVYTFSAVGVDTPDYRAFRSTGVPIPYSAEAQIYLPRVRRLEEALADDGADLVHLTTAGPAGLAARYVVWRTGLPLIGSFHAQLAEYTSMPSGSARLGALMGAHLRWFYGACRYVLVPSHDTRTRLVAAGWPYERLAIWPRGVDAAVFTPERRSVELRERWGVSERRPAILYAGRVSREKGLDVLPALESQLFRMRVPCRFVIVGDGPMLAQLRERIPDAVYTGHLAHQEVAVAMASADLFLFPSETDTAGNVVLEAQASGLPVLVSARGGPRENMIDGETGVVCQDQGPAEHASHLARLLRNPDERRRLSENARAFALMRSWRSSLEPLFAAYRVSAAQRTRADAALSTPPEGQRPARDAPRTAHS
jgi:glycosyltransferase involved in cell wall biosynthesis